MEQNERLASDFYKNLILNIKSPVWQKMGLQQPLKLIKIFVHNMSYYFMREVFLIYNNMGFIKPCLPTFFINV